MGQVTDTCEIIGRDRDINAKYIDEGNKNKQRKIINSNFFLKILNNKILPKKKKKKIINKNKIKFNKMESQLINYFKNFKKIFLLLINLKKLSVFAQKDLFLEFKIRFRNFVE